MKISSLLMAKLPERRKLELIKNIRKNWYFPLSAMGIFCLNARFNVGFFLGVLIAFAGAVIISSQIPSLSDWEKGNPKALRIVSFLAAIGICWGLMDSFCGGWFASPNAMALKERLHLSRGAIEAVSVIPAIVGISFAYLWVLAFLKKFLEVLSDCKVFSDITHAEWIIYSVLVLLTLGWMIYSFIRTNAFYEMPTVNVLSATIYTSDSSILLAPDNAYLTLSHSENDIRQPLFAVFAAPFIGLPYLLGKLTGSSPTVEAILMNSVQVVMLFSAHLMLAKVMKLDSGKRICFMLLVSCTYYHMLFTLMMEQYITAYFWLIFCIYLILEKNESRLFALCGAGGTLIPSIILMPFASGESPFKNFKAWFRDMVRYCLGFIALMLVFCRFDVIFNLTRKLSLLNGYRGHELSFMEKLYQYTAFIHDCILRPNAGVQIGSDAYVSWQLKEATGINLIGIVLLVLAVISVIWNWRKKSSQFAAGWVFLSAFVLLILGWGTSENGLILYALYFGWAFFVLLFQLAEKIEDKLNTKFILPVFSILGVIVLALSNIPSIVEMINFAIQYYPA